MAKTARQLSMNVESKAADILYDLSQQCDLSLTAFIEKVAYYIESHNEKAKESILSMIKDSEEPEA